MPDASYKGSASCQRNLAKVWSGLASYRPDSFVSSSAYCDRLQKLLCPVWSWELYRICYGLLWRKVLLQVGDGLRYLHSLAWVHRDIKPGNIGYDIRGVVKIPDFGDAAPLPSPASTTAPGASGA